MSGCHHIDAEHPRGIQAKNLGFYIACERMILVFLDQLIRNLESAKGFDLPLWSAIPDRIGSPEHMIDTKGLNKLTEQMRTDKRMSGHQLSERRSQFHIDVVDRGLRLFQPAEFGRPRNVSAS